MGGVLILWIRGHCVAFQPLSKGVIREICGYYKRGVLTDVVNSTVYVHWMEIGIRYQYGLSVKIKGRPPLVQIAANIYIFACGRKACSGYCIELTTMSYGAIRDSLLGLSGPAALYDDLHNYVYLFGGTASTKTTRTIQVYNPTKNSWTVVRAEMKFARSNFTAVKYRREAFFLGGCRESSIEAFDLNTGQSRLVFVGFRAALLQNCGGVMEDRLLGRIGTEIVLLEVAPQKVLFRKEINPEHAKLPKRMWVVGRNVYLMCEASVISLTIHVLPSNS